MSTNAELISRALMHLGNRTSYRSTVLSCFKGWVKKQERGPLLPWFLEKETTGLVTVAAQDYIALPDDYLRHLDEGVVLVEDSSGVEHKVIKTPSLERLLVDDSEGRPEAYYLFGGRIYLRPIPDAVYPIRFFYYRKSVVLDDSNTATTDWGLEAEDAVIFGGAAIFASTVMMNQKLAAALEKQEASAMTSLWIANEARIHSGQEYGIED